MASGVMVADSVINIFTCMKVRKHTDDKDRRIKGVLFCLSPDKKTIIPEEGKIIYCGDIGDTISDAYKHFVDMLPLNDCRYGLFDLCYETNETKKEELVFLFWSPECAPLKSKMIYASSKDAIKKKFAGLKHEYQITCPNELKDRWCLADKLQGGGISVISIEGCRH